MDLCPELRFLDDAERLYIVLVYDYYSMYRQFTESDRINKALNHIRTVLLMEINNISPKMEMAIEAYKSLQFDPKRELVNVYKVKIQQLSADLEKALAPSVIKNILDSQKTLKQATEDLVQEIEMGLEAKANLKGGGNLSLLEKLKLNKELYLQVIKKK
jgi:hypothetical protein